MVVEMKIAFERLISRLKMSERRTNEINIKTISQTEMQKKPQTNKRRKQNITSKNCRIISESVTYM